jgi:hypothetical protein
MFSSGILYCFWSSFVTSQSLRYWSSVKCSVPSKVIPMENLFISFFSPRNDSAQCHSIWSNSPYFIASPFFLMNICVLHCLLVGFLLVAHDSTLWRTMYSLLFVHGVYLHSFISLSNIVYFVLEIKQKLSLVSNSVLIVLCISYLIVAVCSFFLQVIENLLAPPYSYEKTRII